MSTSIQDVKKRHEAELLTLPDVVSVGIGLGQDGNPAILVGLKSARSETLSIGPTELEGFKVEYSTIGEVKAQ